ncbi:MAG: CRISPR-associated protein Cas4 [Dethiobacteria bacterium]|jgi:CRISPR-associated exonuclease Cas4
MIPLRVTDLRQYIYCPRIVYFYYVLPIPRRVTRKMEYGHVEHIEISRLEKRRGFKAYGFLEGSRDFQVFLRSARLGLHGLLDMMITTTSGQIYPVEFKHSVSRYGLHQKYQLAAYAMLLEDQYCQPVRYGYLYIIPTKTAVPVEITTSMRNHVKKALSAIRNVIAEERIPGYVRSKSRCTDCEFKNYCADLG